MLTPLAWLLGLLLPACAASGARRAKRNHAVRSCAVEVIYTRPSTFDGPVPNCQTFAMVDVLAES